MSDLSDLQKEIAKAKADADKSPTSAASSPATGVGMRMALELVAGVGVGSLIGYGIDRWLGTMPWFFMICFFLGTAAGFKNMLREAKKLANEEAPK